MRLSDGDARYFSTGIAEGFNFFHAEWVRPEGNVQFSRDLKIALKILLENGFLSAGVLQMSFHPFDHVLFRCFDERQGRAFVVASRCPTHPMNVRVHVGWEIKVNYVGEQLKVDSTDSTGFFIFIAFALMNLQDLINNSFSC